MNAITFQIVILAALMGSVMLWMGVLSWNERKENISAWRFFLVISFQLLISIIFIILFKISFKFKNHLIPLHLVMVGGLVGCGMVLMGALVCVGRFREWKISRYVLAGISATISLFLFILYIVDFSVNKNGANNITYDVFVLYFFKLKDISHVLSLSAEWIYVIITSLVVFVYAIYMRYSIVIYDGVCEFLLPGRPSSLFRDRKRAVKSVVLIALSISFYLFYMAEYFNASHAMFWWGEPIANFAVYWSPIQDNPHRSAVAKEDRRIRANYIPKKPFLEKNVVLIIVDSLRADHMNVYGYERETTPFLKNMFDRGKLMKVEFAIATCPETAGGVLSVLASRNFRSLSSDYNFKLNELLRDQGYKIYYIHSGDQTHYQRLRWFFGKDIDFYADGNNSLKYSTNDDHVIFENLEKIPDYSGTPAFFYFHLMTTHYLGVRHDEFEKYKPSKLNIDLTAFFDKGYEQKVFINRYDNGILEVDSVIKDIFAELDRKGYLPGSIIFISADHGDGLNEHGHYKHDEYIYQEDIRIPLLIYDPEGTPYANLEFASQPDVAPTIIDRLKLPIPSGWEGKSLLNRNIKEFIFSQTRQNPPLYAVIYRDRGKIHKYITGQNKEELYELTGDPGERHNLLPTADSELLRLLREKTSVGFGLIDEPKI